ncbi:MAG: hypothetical protein ACW98K_07605 [Candidatus Kariarchaeaceae archaeon]|jgi:hypothetical protein
MVRNLIDIAALKCKNDLMKLAMSDRSMSVDEERIVNTTISNLQELRNYVRSALMDQFISETEKVNLSFFVEKIAADAMRLASEDKRITFEERRLLQVIRKTVHSLREITGSLKVGGDDHAIKL